jgi:uncharacterized membrane protein
LGDNLTVSLLGIPATWIADPKPQTVRIPAGSQEKVILNIHPPASGEDVIGYHHARLYVFGQNAPEKGIELDFLLKVLAEQKKSETILLTTESTEYTTSPGSEVKIQLLLRNLGQGSEFLEITVQGVPVGWVSLPSPVVILYAGEEKRIGLTLQVPSAADIRAGYYPLIISVM